MSYRNGHGSVITDEEYENNAELRHAEGAEAFYRWALGDLHLDTGVTGGGVGEPFEVWCSCGRTFTGDDPDAASAAQLDHVEAELGGEPEPDAYSKRDVHRAARRAAQALDPRVLEALHGSSSPRFSERAAESLIQDAITDLLHLANLYSLAGEWGDELGPVAIKDRAFNIFEQEAAEAGL